MAGRISMYVEWPGTASPLPLPTGALLRVGIGSRGGRAVADLGGPSPAHAGLPAAPLYVSRRRYLRRSRLRLEDALSDRSGAAALCPVVPLHDAALRTPWHGGSR